MWDVAGRTGRKAMVVVCLAGQWWMDVAYVNRGSGGRRAPRPPEMEGSAVEPRTCMPRPVPCMHACTVLHQVEERMHPRTYTRKSTVDKTLHVLLYVMLCCSCNFPSLVGRPHGLRSQ
jgi:hypothetical protein